MNDVPLRPDEDAAILRTRLTRLLQALKSSRDQNPATLEALERIFPEIAEQKSGARRPALLKLKQWLGWRDAA